MCGHLERTLVCQVVFILLILLIHSQPKDFFSKCDCSFFLKHSISHQDYHYSSLRILDSYVDYFVLFEKKKARLDRG